MTCTDHTSSNLSASPVPTAALDSINTWLVDEDFQTGSWLSEEFRVDPESSLCVAVDSGNLIHATIQPQTFVYQQPSEQQQQQQQQRRAGTEDTRQGVLGRFRGPSHSTSILAQFQDACNFIRQTLEDHHILGATQWTVSATCAESPLPACAPDKVDQHMKRLLPGEQRCRRLAKTYFHHFTGLFALFHVPTFWREYQEFWDGEHRHERQFNALLLALISCARCLSADDPMSFEGDGSSSRNEALQWVRWVETWQSQQAARRTTTESFQIRCLLTISKMLNNIDPEEQYSSSQSLLADAVSSGLHRDRASLGIHESIYEREIRQKIWAVCTELDLAACAELGVPSMVPSLFTDHVPPRNFDDADYGTSTDVEPAHRPDDQLTNGSFAKMAHAVRLVRYDVINIVNNPRRRRALSRTMLVDLRTEICKSLASVPDWPSLANDAAGRSRALFHQAIIQLYLHELLVLLHVPYAPAGDDTSDSSAVDADFQQFICVRSASTIVKIHELVAREGFSTIVLSQSSLLRSGLCLCLLQGPMLNYGIPFPSCRPNTLAFLLNLAHGETQAGIHSSPLNPDSQADLVRSALGILESHVLCLGTHLPPLWLLSAASGYKECWGDASASSACRVRVADNIVALLSRMCLAQKQKSAGLGLSDACFARYIQQIRRACETVGQTVYANTE